MWGELACHKNLQPTTPVLKAGHPVSYSCCLLVCFVRRGFLGFLSPPFCLFSSVLYTYKTTDTTFIPQTEIKVKELVANFHNVEVYIH